MPSVAWLSIAATVGFSLLSAYVWFFGGHGPVAEVSLVSALIALATLYPTIRGVRRMGPGSIRVFCGLLIAMVQVGLTVGLYYGRVQGSGEIFQSDILLFLVPVLAATAAHAVCLRVVAAAEKSLASVFGLAIAAAAAAFYVALWICFNTWGT
jgi:hypothetical protein